MEQELKPIDRRLYRERCKGMLVIPSTFMDDFMLPKVFERLEFIPLDVTFEVDTNNFRMLGTSHYFDELEPGERTPQYNVILTESGRGQLQKLKAERVGRP